MQDFLLENSLTASTIKAPQSAVVKAAIDAINLILTTDNATLDDFQKITDAIEAIQDTLSVDDANYDTLQEIADKLKVAETKLATIATGAEVNVQADWNETNNTSDAFINNKPALGTASSKDVGTAAGNLQENGAVLNNSQTVETDATGKFITASKNTAYNANFGTGNTDVARGDASYLKADTYTQTEINNALATNSTNDRARANHTGTQAIATVTGLQTALDSKEATANKGVANGYASLDGSAKVPASQLPSYVDDVVEYANLASFPATGETGKVYIALDTNLTYRWSGSTYVKLNDVDLTNYFNKTTDTLDNVSAGTTNKHFTFTLEAKLNGIEDLAQVNIQSNFAATSGDAFILNKSTQYIPDSFDKRYVTDAEKTVIGNTSGTNTGDETTASIQTKRPLKTIEGQSLEGAGNIDLTKADVGLANVDNTSDADKPVSTAQQTALDGKLAKASNLSDVNNRQTALDNLTDVASATNEYVLTKDTTTGNAIFKPATGGGSGTNLSLGTTTVNTLDINSDTGTNVTIPAATPSHAGLFTTANKGKLDSIEPNATADQSDSEIKTAYENNANTNAFTDAEKTNLANQSGTNTGDEVAATESVAGIAEIATQAEAQAGTDNTNKFLNPLRNKQAFDAFLPQKFGTTSGTVAQGNDNRFIIKRLNILIGSSPSSQKKGVSFSYGATIGNPFFSLAMTSSNNNDAFCVKVINITSTSAYLEVYRADGSGWGDTNLACFVTIYSGTY